MASCFAPVHKKTPHTHPLNYGTLARATLILRASAIMELINYLTRYCLNCAMPAHIARTFGTIAMGLINYLGTLLSEFMGEGRTLRFLLLPRACIHACLHGHASETAPATPLSRATAICGVDYLIFWRALL